MLVKCTVYHLQHHHSIFNELDRFKNMKGHLGKPESIEDQFGQNLFLLSSDPKTAWTTNKNLKIITVSRKSLDSNVELQVGPVYIFVYRGSFFISWKTGRINSHTVTSLKPTVFDNKTGLLASVSACLTACLMLIHLTHLLNRFGSIETILFRMK